MATGRVERRLAAVLAADVAGYSRLMGTDEVGTLDALKTLRRDIVDPGIAARRGRIVKTTGDGLLVEFASAVEAVTCAMEVQARMSEVVGTASHKILFRTASMSATSSSTATTSSAMVSMSLRVSKTSACRAGCVCRPAPSSRSGTRPTSPSAISAKGR
jgi:class 3 adenylate cyclase